MILTNESRRAIWEKLDFKKRADLLEIACESTDAANWKWDDLPTSTRRNLSLIGWDFAIDLSGIEVES